MLAPSLGEVTVMVCPGAAVVPGRPFGSTLMRSKTWRGSPGA